MQFFVKEQINFDNDPVGIATAFCNVLKHLLSQIQFSKIAEDNQFQFLKHIFTQEFINIGSLVQSTSFFHPEQSIIQLYNQLPEELKEYFQISMFCPKCQVHIKKFYLAQHNALSVQQSINNQFCETCSSPLDLVRPPFIIIFERKVSEFQQNFNQIKQIPQSFQFFTNQINYKLMQVTTVDSINDVCQNIVKNVQQKLMFNKQFDYDEEKYYLNDELQFYCQINKYAAFLETKKAMQYYGAYLKRDQVEQYLEDSSYGEIQRLLGKAKFYYYFIDCTGQIEKLFNYTLIQEQYNANENKTNIQLNNGQYNEQIFLSQKQIKQADQQNIFKYNNIANNNVPIKQCNNQTIAYQDDNLVLDKLSFQQKYRYNTCRCGKPYDYH